MHASSRQTHIYYADQGCIVPQLCLHSFWLDLFHNVLKCLGLHSDAEHFLSNWYKHILAFIATTRLGVVSTG